MELCWCCGPCIQERANLKALKHLSPASSPAHNNNNADKPDSPGGSQAEAIPTLTLSPNPIRRRVTFADASGTNVVYFAGCNLDFDDSTVNSAVNSDVMCRACVIERSNSTSPITLRKTPLDHPDHACNLGAASHACSMVRDRHMSQQFAEETDSSHVGPPDNSHCRISNNLRLVIPENSDTGASDCLQHKPHECCHVEANLQQLIANMLVPCDVIVNNQSRIIPVETDNDEVQNLFVDAFLHNNRLEHMIQVMGYHPHYLECFLKTQQYLLRGDGPLPYDYRHYIAIMAAGRHQCSYIIKIQTTEFLLQGGDERWLRGLEHIPQKLRDLYEVNKILAHRPWLLDQSHIEKLTRGTENWSLSELMHAIALLAHFHALSSFVYGCGVNAEIDQEDGHTYRISSVNENGATNDHSGPTTPSSSLDANEGGIEELMRKMRQLTEEAAAAETSQEELLKRFEKIESQSAELPAASKQPSVQADLLRYVHDADFVYQDFARRGHPTKFPCFRAQDYSWEEQGFSLANRLYTDIGTFLDDKFRTAYDLTYNTMGHCIDVDTTSFRRAIWNYIHSMFGIRHDDYDYNEVNQLMERSLKAYIKTVTCFPERVIKKDYDSFMKEFKHSEKVHVNLMLLEAKMQAELLYALRAIMKYMT